LPDNLLQQMENHMSKKDLELARSKVIEIRSEGIDKSIRDLTEQLRAGFPDINENIVTQIETSPGFVQRVLDRQMGPIAAAVPDIVKKMISMAKNGNVQAVDRINEWAALGRKGPLIQTNIQNNVNLQGQSNDYIDAQFRELASELD